MKTFKTKKMKKIYLSESQLTRIIKNILVEERKRTFPPKTGFEMSDDDKILLNKAYEDYGATSPSMLYKKVKEHDEVLDKINAGPGLRLDVSRILGALEFYYGALGFESFSRDRSRDTNPDENPSTPRQNISKFSDRFKFNRRDLTGD